MNIIRLTNDDISEFERFLSHHIETSLFLLSNSRKSGLVYEDRAYCGEYFGAFDDQRALVGVLVHYWNGNVLFQAPDLTVLGQLISSFKSTVDRPIHGILGAQDQASKVIEGLSIPNSAFSADRDETLYSVNLTELLEQKEYVDTSLKMVEARDIDRDFLVNWLIEYNVEGLAATHDESLVAIATEHADRLIGDGDSWVLLADDVPVSLSCFNARLPEIVQVGPVWTPPMHRNKGYARILLAETLKLAQRQGIEKAILFTDNPAAAKAYEAIGFREIGSYTLALLNEPLTI